MKAKIMAIALVLTLASAKGLPGELPELGRFVIDEPLGVNWSDEWINFDVTIDTAEAREIALVIPDRHGVAFQVPIAPIFMSPAKQEVRPAAFGSNPLRHLRFHCSSVVLMQ